MKAKVFDLTEKFTIEKPVLKIGQKEYQIDNSVENAMKLNSLDTTNKSENEYVLEFLTLALGEKAIKEIDFYKYPLGTLMEVFYVVTSALTEEDVETIKTRFQNHKE